MSQICRRSTRAVCPSLKRRRQQILRAYDEKRAPGTRPQQQIDVTLRRPLGMTLAENAEKSAVFVEEIASGSNAEKSGKIQVGDVVRKVSAMVFKGDSKEGYGQRLYDDWEKVMFDCEGQDFKAVMSAIDSNNPRWGINDVTLVLSREESVGDQ